VDKLIVTILSIGLTAVALIWGADYISSFYQGAQARAKAQRWIAEAAQIAAAARQAGNLSTTGDDWTGAGTAALLVPNYLASLPQHSGAYVFEPCNLSSGNTNCPEYATDATMIMAPVESAQVCQEIQRLANRDNTTLTRYTAALGSSGYTIPKNANQQFGCAWFDLNGNDSYDPPGTDEYYFLYRVFLDR